MSNLSDQVIDLDYDSPLEGVFSILASPIYLGLTFLAIWFICVNPGNQHSSPLWSNFPVAPVALTFLCIWGLGVFLKFNYDVRYQLDPKTQQLDLVRRIFGFTFKTRVLALSEVYSTAIISTWSDDKEGNRSWRNAIGLVTGCGQIVRVSSFTLGVPTKRAVEVARLLGIPHYPHQPEAGCLKARRSETGQVVLSYEMVPDQPITIGIKGILLTLACVALFLFGVAFLYSTTKGV
ncbi:hypothetical protein JST97_02970 [bacterium]|nr:hypothetical protein [bacterium]